MSSQDPLQAGRTALVCTLLACCLGLVLFASGARAAEGSISGTVTDATSGEGVPGIEVCATLLEWSGEGFLGGCERTGADGGYDLFPLQAGDYEVEFWTQDTPYLGPRFYDEKEVRAEADPVTVADQPVTNIDAVLTLGGRLEGTVTEAGGGAPVDQFEVCAWELADPNAGSCADTDSSGEYAIQALPTAEYVVEFWTGSTSFIPEYWDDQPTWDQADPVSVIAGGVVSGIDAQLEVEGSPGSGQGIPTSTPSVALPAPAVLAPPTARKRCRKGFHRKRVKGKKRCVRKHRRHAQRR